MMCALYVSVTQFGALVRRAGKNPNMIDVAVRAPRYRCSFWPETANYTAVDICW